MAINKDILIEDLVREYPPAVRYLQRQNIKCLECGEAIWGTLEEAAREKGYNDEDISRFVRELNEMAARES
jgi:hybrid cluster-associated redox disulfide protein